MVMEKRAVLALFISFLVLMAFQYIAVQKRKELKGPEKIEERKAVKEEVKEEVRPEKREEERVILETSSVVETPLYKAEFTSDGEIKFLGLKEFTSDRKRESPYSYLKEREEFFQIIGNQLEGEYSFSPGSLSIPEWQGVQFRPSRKRILLSGSIPTATLIFEGIKNNLLIEKEYSFSRESYGINLKISVQNSGNIEKLVNYTVICGKTEKKPDRNLARFLEIIVSENGSLKKFRPQKVKGERTFPSTDFLSHNSQYSLLFLKSSPLPSFLKEGEKEIVSGLKVPSFSVAPGEKNERNFFFYAGPHDYPIVEREGKGIESAIKGGPLATLSRFALQFLTFLYGLVHNWGVAIILLTILVKIVLFPVMKGSIRSMKGMQKLQPYMKDLREKYKDKPQEMQKELVELYKRHKVNPVGGCLPLFLQMPIFIAIFLVLQRAAVLRGAGFCLWMTDLSLPDAVMTIGNFPLNLLPLFMGITMFLQQKMTTVDPSQKMMTFFMPIFLTVILYSFPSGLMLYWVVTNCLSIVEQKLSTR